MTSLAKQLQRLAVPHTQSILTNDKKRVSLLFDTREAANLDRDTVFALGISGLEELENVDPVFAEYESSLFNKSSPNWSRSMQTREVNDKLDDTIGKFLVRLSPYLLLKCTHKVLEWLVFRYQVEQYNIDDLILCALPYHDTRIFVRIMQLLKLDDPTDKWNWLEPSAKSGVPLARNTFVNHCKKDPGFLALVTQMVPRFVKIHGPDSQQLRGVISLYTGALLGVAQHREDLTERVMSIVVPSLVLGFKSKCLEYKSASYMVLGQIVVQTQVKETVLEQILPILCKRISPRTSQEAVTCLAIVYQTQKIKTLSKRTFKRICRIPGLIQLLSFLAKQCSVSRLLHAWLERLVPVALMTEPSSSGTSSDASTDDLGPTLPEYDRLLVAAILDVKLPEPVVAFLAKSVIQQLLSRRQNVLNDADEDAVSSWQQQCKELLTSLERKYPLAFDTAVDRALTESKGDSEALDVLQEMMSLTNSPIRHQVMADSSTSLVLGLNHAQVAQRVLAVRQMAAYIKNHAETSHSDAFVEDMVLQRLGDDAPDVVLAILNLGSVMCSIVNKQKLVVKLLRIVDEHRVSKTKQKWQPVVTKSLQLLSSDDLASCDPDLSLTLLPHLLPTLESEVKSADVLLRSKLMQQDELFKDLCEAYVQTASKWDKKTARGEGCIQFLKSAVKDHLVAALGGCTVDKYKQAMDLLTKRALESSKAVKDLTLVLGITQGLLAAMRDDRIHDAAGRGTVETGHRLMELVESLVRLKVKKGTKGSASFIAIEFAIVQLCLALKKLPTPGKVWLNPEDSHTKLLLKVLDLLMKEASSSEQAEKWRPLLIAFAQKHLESSVFHKLLSLTWSPGGATSVSVISHAGSFHLACHVWRETEGETLAKLLKKESAVLPGLLISLASPHQAVRRAALGCIHLLRKKCRSLAASHTYLLKKLVKNFDEILADPQHASRALGVVYDIQSVADNHREKVVAKKWQSLSDVLEWVKMEDTPVTVKEQLLYILKEVSHEQILDTVLPLAHSILSRIKDNPTSITSVDLDIVQHVLQRYDEETSPRLKHTDASWEILTMALKAEQGIVGKITPQVMAMEQITREMFISLPDTDMQCRLVSCIVDAGVATKLANVASAVQRTLKQLKLQGYHVEQELKVTANTSELTTVKGQKRTRTQKTVAPIKYKRVILILEVLQSRKKVKDSHDLAALLFRLLERLQTEEAEETEYCKQLALSCILNLSAKWTEKNKPEKQESFNVEALVQCIRNSSSPQTQQQALLVMATIAHLFPEYILHNVISVFTFMGGSLLQQDDSHTFHIITRTIQTVIPALIKAHQAEQSKTEDLDELIANILRVFVDARHHVPRHRCQVLFRQLINTVGAERHLATIMVLLLEKGVLMKDVPSAQEAVHEEGASTLDKDIEFAVNICDQLDVSIQVTACSRVVQLLHKMTKLHETQGAVTTGRGSGKAKPSLPPLNIASLNQQQLRLLQYHCTRLITAVLAREGFVSQIVSQSDEAGLNDVMATDFGTFLRETLGYMSEVARQSGTQGGGGAGKFWKALLHKIYDILEKVNYLLPSRVFLEVSTSLMAHEVASVRKKSLELLNLKLQQLQLGGVSQEEVESLLSVVDKLVGLVRRDEQLPRGNDADIANIQQMALLGLKLLCRLLGSQKPHAFKEVFNVTVALLHGKSTPPAVLGSSMLCLAELCSSLKAHAIPHLAAFMKPLLRVLGNMDLLASNELLLTCCLTALQRVVTSLPHFLSQYLLDILLVVCKISCIVKIEEASKKSQPAIRLKAVRHQLAVVVAPRVLLPAVSDCYNKLLEENQPALTAILSVLTEHVETMSLEDLSAHHATLLNFFCHALDLRNQELSLSGAETEAVEGEVISAVLAMVVRLSESSFRPMFYKLYDWACRDDTAESKLRRLIFFRLCEQLSEKLRSLFNLFVGHIMKMACQLLDANNTMKGEVDFFASQENGEAKSCVLLTYILGCLYKCMLYDTDGFVTKELFTLMMQPIVDQLENFLGDDATHESRIATHVTACISQLAVASRDDSSWKSLNYQVLLKTRHSNAKVRFAALQAVESLAEKLGEECMVLLPETIPFLAELMEDESEEVEQKCQQVIASLEKFLGESLQKYF